MYGSDVDGVFEDSKLVSGLHVPESSGSVSGAAQSERVFQVATSNTVFVTYIKDKKIKKLFFQQFTVNKSLLTQISKHKLITFK
jgi:hypothetical protein